MGGVVLGIVRSATRLEALVYEATPPGEGAALWEGAHACGLRALAEGERPALSAAWARLAAVERWDAATLADVRLVLRETVPGGRAGSVQLSEPSGRAGSVQLSEPSGPPGRTLLA